MFTALTTTATAAAPHVGRAILTGGKAVVALGVAQKASKYAQREASQMMDRFKDAKDAAQEARVEQELEDQANVA